MVRFLPRRSFAHSEQSVRRWMSFAAAILLLSSAATPAWAAALEDALNRFDAERPRTVEALTAAADPSPGSVAAAPNKGVHPDTVAAVDEAAAELIRWALDPRPDVVLGQVEWMLLAKAKVDAGLTELFALRAALAELPPDDVQHRAIRRYLQAVSRSIDLAGHLRYMEFDVFNNASATLAQQPAARQKLVELFQKYRSSVGAIVMSGSLSDPAAAPLRAKVLELIAATGETECLPALAGFVTQAGLPPALVVQGVEAIRSVGLPQDVRPGQDPTLPTPAITAARLHQIVSRLN
ncbi:MAG TPA: hypothetical protein VMF30_19890, partial [Pirellulales bacterium]|nr:hypothetical protein [Pirellulales bacterium]